MKKDELYSKLQKVDKTMLKRMGMTLEELKYLQKKVLNDQLGLKLNFSEMDNEEKYNYLVLSEEKELSFNVKDDEKSNLLIEGDNYHALKALKTAGTKVDVIYIDPPYNTGKEFAYNDDFGNTKTVGSDDPHKHSKWLSFMKKRLMLARDLLSSEGVIFVSIDDNEQAYLKVLMDEIFGENNFINNIVWKNRTTPNDPKINMATTHEYVITYAKNKNNIVFKGIEREFSNYRNPDNDPRGPWIKDNPTAASGNYSFEIVNPFTGQVYKPTTGRYWAFSEKRVKQWTDDGKMVFPDTNNSNFFIKKYKAELKSQFLTHPSIYDESLTMHGTKEAKSIFGDSPFQYPKPSDLIKYLLSLVDKKDALILDFFAGTGTTGQATLALNADDKGSRRFILVTNNERTGINTIDFPELGIARAITRERIYRVINGLGTSGNNIEWRYSKEIKSFVGNSLKYLVVKPVDKYEGDFEEIDVEKDLYKVEFDKDIDITDFR